MIITENTDIVFHKICEFMCQLDLDFNSFLGSNFPGDSEEL